MFYIRTTQKPNPYRHSKYWFILKVLPHKEEYHLELLKHVEKDDYEVVLWCEDINKMKDYLLNSINN